MRLAKNTKISCPCRCVRERFEGGQLCETYW